ncbi:hypothetical protein ACFQ51_42205 [Streptomyces kaempferi]
MTEITIRPEPRTTALTLIRETALDHVAPGGRDDEPPLPNRHLALVLTDRTPLRPVTTLAVRALRQLAERQACSSQSASRCAR